MPAGSHQKFRVGLFRGGLAVLNMWNQNTWVIYCLGVYIIWGTSSPENTQGQRWLPVLSSPVAPCGASTCASWSCPSSWAWGGTSSQKARRTPSPPSPPRLDAAVNTNINLNQLFPKNKNMRAEETLKANFPKFICGAWPPSSGYYGELQLFMT